MIKRIGIFEKWEMLLKRYLKSLESMNARNSMCDEKLNEYQLTGHFLGSISKADVQPPLLAWEYSFLQVELGYRSLMYVSLYEISALKGDELRSNYLFNIFELSKLSFLIDAHMYALYTKRFGFERSIKIDITHVPRAAVGVLIGKIEDAKRFFVLLIKAFNRNWFIYKDYPIFYFMLRLMSDYLNEPLLSAPNNSENEVVFQELFLNWRVRSPEVIEGLCLSVCDYHTHQCKPNSGSQWHEFSNGYWSGWPIEINLLFKLRQMIGLENPDLDHPLMNSTLGQLPKDIPFELDDLTERVIGKMVSQGFDESEVFDRVYFEKF
jgi:hypothetical protein